MKKKIALAALAGLFLLGVNAYSQEEIDENSLFGSDNIVGTNKLTDNTIASNADKESLSITGKVRNDTTYTLSRNFITNWSTNLESNTFGSTMQGNLLVDVRLRQGIKAFANIEVGYNPFGQLVPHYYTVYDTNGLPVMGLIAVDTNYTTLVLKEFFIDANIGKAVFLRAGKQVLQWGTSYFWNPSDLINIQRKSFADMSAYREGSSGLKITVPFGTVFNLYGYVDITKITNVMDTALSGKMEFLIGATEFSLSAWAKRGYYPVYAMDFTSRIWTIDLRGEASLSCGDNYRKILSNNNLGIPVVGQDTNWVPRISFGFTKSFDFLDVSDRISVTGEFFWNGGGYYDPKILENSTSVGTIMNPFNPLYQANYLSAYYFALFTSVSEFFNPDLGFSYNLIMNMVDWSSMMMASLSWNPVYNFTIAFNLTGYLGEKNREYTYSGSALSFGLTSSLSF